ncbi:MAG: NlpC/P60 family protein [Raoultibacter sp.]
MSGQNNTLSRRAFMGGATVFGASLFMTPAIALADPTSADKQAEAQTALVSLNTMQSNLDQASNAYHAALEEHENAQNKMTEAQTRIDAANGQIFNLQDKLGTRARSMYRSGGSSFLDLLLGATSFEEFATNWDILNQMNESDAAMVQQTKDLRTEVHNQKAEYAKQEQIAAEKTQEAKRVADEAASTVSAMQATYESLSTEAAALLEQERAAQVAAQAAAAAKVVEEASKPAASSTSNGGGSSNSGGSTSGGGSSSGGGGSTSGGGSSSGGGGQTPSTPDTPSGGGGATGPAYGSVLDYAYSKLGSPYVWGGKGPDSFDCSGFVAWCYAQVGVSVPSYTGSLMGLPQVYSPQPGDIAVNYEHTGLYIGGGSMIHAATFGVGVITGPVQGGMIFVRP